MLELTPHARPVICLSRSGKGSITSQGALSRSKVQGRKKTGYFDTSPFVFFLMDIYR